MTFSVWKIRLVFNSFWFAILTILLFFVVASSQSQTTILHITGIDISQFPNVNVSIYGENLQHELGEVPITLKQDGAIQEIVGSEMRIVGTQITFLLATDQIPTASTSHSELSLAAGVALRKLVKDHIFTLDNDWMMSISTGSNGKPIVLHSWSKDFQSVADSVYTFQPITTTSLTDLAYFALEQFNNDSLPTNQQKALIIFSDGSNLENDITIDDVINKAVSSNIRIFTVSTSKINSQTQRYMNRLSSLTNGYPYTFGVNNSLTPLWQSIAATRTQRILTYRSDTVQPQETSIHVETAPNKLITDKFSFPSINMYPIRAYIISPANEIVIDREAPNWDSPLNEIPYKQIEVILEFDFVGYPRVIRKLEVMIGGTLVEITQPPFDRFWLSTRNFDTGTYPVRIRVIDEFGLVSEITTFFININVRRPPTPFPTTIEVIPQPTDLITAEPISPGVSLDTSDQHVWLLIYFVLGLALVSLIISSYVLLSHSEIDFFSIKDKIIFREKMNPFDKLDDNNASKDQLSATDLSDRAKRL